MDLHIFRQNTVTAVSYENEFPICYVYAIFYVSAVGPAFVLTDDNARTHTAVIVDDYLESVGIARMERLALP